MRLFLFAFLFLFAGCTSAPKQPQAKTSPAKTSPPRRVDRAASTPQAVPSPQLPRAVLVDRLVSSLPEERNSYWMRPTSTFSVPNDGFPYLLLVETLDAVNGAGQNFPGNPNQALLNIFAVGARKDGGDAQYATVGPFVGGASQSPQAFYQWVEPGNYSTVVTWMSPVWMGLFRMENGASVDHLPRSLIDDQFLKEWKQAYTNYLVYRDHRPRTLYIEPIKEQRDLRRHIGGAGRASDFAGPSTNVGDGKGKFRFDPTAVQPP